jgi:hypothetical protein
MKFKKALKETAFHPAKLSVLQIIHVAGNKK